MRTLDLKQRSQLSRDLLDYDEKKCQYIEFAKKSPFMDK